jgi:hypothetical protein
MANLSASLSQLMDLIGCECIYKERGLVFHCKLLAVVIKEDMLELKFRRIPSPGFSKRSIRSFIFSCTKEYVSFDSNRIGGTIVGVEIFFQRDQVDDLVLFMKTLPDTDLLLRKIREFRRLSVSYTDGGNSLAVTELG